MAHAMHSWAVHARWSGYRGKPLNVQRSHCASITERLAVRVKGLTALFCILLLTTAVLPDLSVPQAQTRAETRMASSNNPAAAVRQNVETRLITAGRGTRGQHRIVKPPGRHRSARFFPPGGGPPPHPRGIPQR